MTTEARPFRLNVSDSELQDLQKRLLLARFPDELEDAGWAYGAPLSDIKRLVNRWKNGYDWRAAERSINRLPMFTLPISVEGFGILDIHIVHKRSAVHGAIPLLFCHGWPGHFMEVQKLLEPLTSPSDPRFPAFHVVAPSLPNFGFSEGVKRKGFDISKYAETCHKVMLALGYKQYVTQGGDWGSWITRSMALQYGGSSVRAFHTNFSRGRAPYKWTQPTLYWYPFTQEERKGLERTDEWLSNGLGYGQIMSTKPQTLGYSLADSPVGLLAWIYEKLIDWSDTRHYRWEDDEVLTWVMIYWFSRAGPAASARIYYEAVQNGGRDDFDVPRNVPMGMSWFPREIYQLPSSYIRATANVVYEARHDKGGHFAAHEQPEALIADMRKMFGRGGVAFNVVRGLNGYPAGAKL